MTRSSWNSYRLEDGLNIYGAPNFLGVPVLAGGFEFGDAVADTLVIKGRLATGSIAGAALDIDATYTYDALSEIRADVSDWAGIGTTFHGEWSRISTSDPAGTVLYGKFMYVANGPAGGVGVDIGYLQGFLYNVMGKGGSTIGMMRGGEIKLEWAADDTITNAVGLIIEFMGLAAPTNVVFGLRFEDDSAAGAMAAMFQEIQMKTGGITIISNAVSPNGVVTAPVGSLCVVSSGSGAGDRLFINTDSGTTWTNVVTAA